MSLLNRVKNLTGSFIEKPLTFEEIEGFKLFKPDYIHPEGAAKLDLSQCTMIELILLTREYINAFKEFIFHLPAEGKTKNLWRYQFENPPGPEKSIIFDEKDYKFIESNKHRFYEEYYNPLRRMFELPEKITARDFIEEILPKLKEVEENESVNPNKNA